MCDRKAVRREHPSAADRHFVSARQHSRLVDVQCLQGVCMYACTCEVCKNPARVNAACKCEADSLRWGTQRGRQQMCGDKREQQQREPTIKAANSDTITFPRAAVSTLDAAVLNVLNLESAAVLVEMFDFALVMASYDRGCKHGRRIFRRRRLRYHAPRARQSPVQRLSVLSRGPQPADR